MKNLYTVRYEDGTLLHAPNGSMSKNYRELTVEARGKLQARIMASFQLPWGARIVKVTYKGPATK